MPYYFFRSSFKFEGHKGWKIDDFDPNWAFRDCNFSLYSQKWCTKLNLITDYTPCFNEVERGVNWFHLVRPSVRPSVRLWSESYPLCIFNNNLQHVWSISYLHILSSNFRRFVTCKVCFNIQTFLILANSLYPRPTKLEGWVYWIHLVKFVTLTSSSFDLGSNKMILSDWHHWSRHALDFGASVYSPWLDRARIEPGVVLWEGPAVAPCCFLRQ